MKLDDAIGKFRAAFVHNPRHFYSNSFERTFDNRGRKVVRGRSRGRKNFKIVCILKHK